MILLLSTCDNYRYPVDNLFFSFYFLGSILRSVLTTESTELLIISSKTRIVHAVSLIASILLVSIACLKLFVSILGASFSVLFSYKGISSIIYK